MLIHEWQARVQINQLVHSALYFCRLYRALFKNWDYLNVTTLHLIHSDVLMITLNAARREFHKAFMHMNQNILNYRLRIGEGKMKKAFSGILLMLLLTSTVATFLAIPMASGTVYNYTIVSVTKTGQAEITVRLQVRYCPACNPNYASNPGCKEFTHGYPTPYYPYQYWCGGLSDGRYIAVRIKDSAGTILGTQKLVCNPTNWPMNVILTRDFVFTGVSIVTGNMVVAEADVYCSWCGHWYPTPVSLETAPLKVVIDPGHSLTDAFPKNLEYAINKGVADKVKSKLEIHGISAIFTNPNDAPSARATYTNNLKPDIFASLHCNALEGFDEEGNPIGTANGREVWIYDDTDTSQQATNELDLAKRTLDGLTKKTGSVFFYPTGKPGPYGYAGWLAGGPGYPPYVNDHYHIGQDIPANVGDTVRAIADGEVISISGPGYSHGWDHDIGDNNVGILVRHKLKDETEFLALYGHVHSGVSIGDPVRAGEAFATIGPYGSIPHLHFGIRSGGTVPPSPWGSMPLSKWPDTNGFVDPIEWITTKEPAPSEPRKPVPKEKQNPWPSGIPILRQVTVCPAVLHEMEFYDYSGAVCYKGITYQNMLELMNADIWREDAAQGVCNGIIEYFEGRGLTYAAKSPVDLVITDPNGLRISRQFNEIPGATYSETDLDADGDLDDQIRIPDRKVGEYIITVVPEPDALPTDTYTLEVSLFGESITIAQNVRISDIPAEPYIIISTETGIIPPIIDNIPPTTTLEIGEPKYVDAMDNTYVTFTTPFTLTAEDNPGGTGVESIFYHIYDAGWLEFSAPFYLTGLSDGEYSIDYYSTDTIGNTEPTHTFSITLDNSGPLISIENPPAGWALQDGVTFIASASDSSGTHGLNFSIREANGDQGIPVGLEDIPATYDAITGRWNWHFNTLQLPDGYYIVLVKAEDNLGHTTSTTVPYSIRNWAVLERLPSTPNSKAGRIMPVKFALRVAASVDPTQPFVYNEELTIKIYATDKPSNILQTSTFGITSRDYRIDIPSEKYITNFKTLSSPKTYRVEIWRKDMLIGSFEFKTTK